MLLVTLVAEILDRLVVQQTVDRLRTRLAVDLVHRAADLHPPCGEADGETDIGEDRDQRDGREPPVRIRPDKAGDEQRLDQRGDDVEHAEPERRLDRNLAALDRPADPARLPIEMEPQRQRMEMPERLDRNAPDDPLLDPREHGVAQLAERARRDPQAAIGDDQPDRDRDERRDVAVMRQPVDRSRIDERHQDGRELGPEQARHRDDDPGFGRPVAARPEIGQEMAERRPGGTAGGSTRQGRIGRPWLSPSSVITHAAHLALSAGLAKEPLP